MCSLGHFGGVLAEHVGDGVLVEPGLAHDRADGMTQPEDGQAGSDPALFFEGTE
jgi:hypothetical protein